MQIIITGKSGTLPQEDRIMSEKDVIEKYPDTGVNVKIKLAFMWTALMFFYIYNDILSFFQPGHVADLVEGQLEGVVFNQAFLVGAAALMALPGLMVILSVVLKARPNRIVNIVFGIFHILVLAGTQFVGESAVWIYWRMYEVIEGILLVLIIVTAWRWK